MKNGLGQYFTTNKELQAACVAFCRNASKGRVPILEPSAGQGDLIQAMHAAYPSAPTHAVEIDPDLPPAHMRGKRDKWICADFLTVDLPRKTYRTIVGNPPYVRHGATNLYLLFVEKCVRSLAKGGELVFVLPSDFFKLTGASKLLAYMCEQGAFTDIYHPQSEKLFVGASVDVMVVRYEKTPGLPKLCRDYTTQRDIGYTTDGGIVTFCDEAAAQGCTLESAASVHVGLVSGCDEVFANEDHGNTSVLIGPEKVKRYVIPSGASDPLIKSYLEAHKDRLLSRRIRSFGENNWYEWGGLRNIDLMRTRAGEPCAYVSTLTRSETPAFVGVVQPFGAALVCILPKPGAKINLSALVSYLNDPAFRSQYVYSGRFKIGQRLLRFARLPVGVFSA